MTACDWSVPGHDRFTIDAAAWVQRAYPDIPRPVLVELASRIRRHAYSDQVVITADSIRGTRQYEATISNMGFGRGRICATVTRPKLQGRQGALVYTVDGYSIGVAAACGNPFRLIERREARPAPVSGGGGNSGPLVFEAPSAGLATIAVDPAVTPDSAATVGDPPSIVGATVFAQTVSIYAGAVGVLVNLGAVSPVPEPGSALLLIAGVCLLALMIQTRRKS